MYVHVLTSQEGREGDNVAYINTNKKLLAFQKTLCTDIHLYSVACRL
jgi:hypothetical protein